MIKLIGNDQFVTTKQVTAGQRIIARALVQHNYPALSNPAKMMLVGRFGIAERHYFKAGSTPYNEDGELIDYSGEGNDAALSNNNCLWVDNATNGVGRIEIADINFTGSDVIYINATVKRVGTYFYLLSMPGNGGGTGGVNMNGTTIRWWKYKAGYGYTFCTVTTPSQTVWRDYIVKIDFSLMRMDVWVDGVYINYAVDTIPPGLLTYTLQWFFSGQGEAASNGYINQISVAKTTDSNKLLEFLFSEGSGTKLYDVTGNGRDGVLTPNLTYLKWSNLGDKAWNLIRRHTLVTLDASLIRVPYTNADIAMYNPATPVFGAGEEYSERSSGNFHNTAETEIDLGEYGAKNYSEMKELAIFDDRFELYEDGVGNISEIIVTKLEEKDTEHYPEESNSAQTLIESGNLTSPIKQYMKFIICGGENNNIPAEKTFVIIDGAQFIIIAAIAGIEGNYIQMVLVEGAIRAISVSNGNIITITLTYESGDNISDCLAEFDSVNEYIGYSIVLDGALSDISEYLEGGFTYELEILELYLNGSIFPIIHTSINVTEGDFGNSIRKLSLFDIARGQTLPVVSSDKEITFYNMIYSTVKSKEDIGIVDKNLVKQVSEFPADPEFGQIAVMAGKSYIYRES